MFWYRSRQNVKPSGLSGSPWLIGIWRFRPLVRMVDRCAADRCAAPPMTASPSVSAQASANRIHRADANVRRIRESYNDQPPLMTHAEVGRRSSGESGERRWATGMSVSQREHPHGPTLGYFRKLAGTDR